MTQNETFLIKLLFDIHLNDLENIKFDVDQANYFSDYFNTNPTFWLKWKENFSKLIKTEDEYKIVCNKIDTLLTIKNLEPQTPECNEFNLLVDLANIYVKISRRK
jgi:hypothetical protein